MKKFFIIVFLFISLQCLYAQLRFGVNANIIDPVYQKLLIEGDKELVELTREANIKFIRYPGGNVARFYFWNSSKYIVEAYQSIRKYLSGNRLEFDKMNKADLDIPDTLYSSFLRFCKKNSISPVIQINSTFYIDEGKIFQVEKFKNENKNNPLPVNRWNKILDYLINQLKFTHSIVDSVFWEIGNEEYSVYDAETYGSIVERITDTIKRLYPQDKVIVSFYNSQKGNYFRQNKKEEWNRVLVNFLKARNKLKTIDFFAPHYYNNTKEEIVNENDLEKKIKTIDIPSLEKELLSFFPGNYKPSFFYTEYSVFLTSKSNKSYNTQTHALLMFYYLMKFYSGHNSYGILHHGYTAKASYLYLNRKYLSEFKYLNAESDFISNYYKTPQAKAISYFYKTSGSKFIKYLEKNGTLILVTSSEKEIFIQLLNYSNKKTEFDLKDLEIIDRAKISNVELVLFDKLFSYHWAADIKRLNLISEKNKLSIKPYSIMVVKLNKK